MIQFETKIIKHPDKDAAYIEIPLDVEQEFGAKRVKVKALFDGVEYRGSIVKMGLPCYMIGLTKEIRKQIGKNPGDVISVQLTKDEEERVVELPKDFKEQLEKNAAASTFYSGLSFSAKRKYAQWITGAKQEATREKRMAEAVKKLEQGLKL